MVCLTGFHVTDKSNVGSIMANGFTYNKNTKHWLGNGIYFFDQINLAEWWSNKSNKLNYGKIKEPAILEVFIEDEDNHIADLRKFEVYNFFNDKYTEYKKAILNKRYQDSVNEDEIRCAFFEWIKSKADINIVIAVFYKNSFNEILTTNNELKNIGIKFPEVQICVYNNKVISDIVEKGEQYV